MKPNRGLLTGKVASSIVQEKEKQPSGTGGSVIKLPTAYSGSAPPDATGQSQVYGQPGTLPHKLRDLASPDKLAVFAIGGLLARATLLGTIAPFHLAYAAAIAVGSRDLTVTITQAVIFLVARSFVAEPVTVMAEGIALCMLMGYLAYGNRRAIYPSNIAWEAGALAAGTALISSLVVYVIHEGGTIAVINGLYLTVIAGLLAILFCYALNALYRLWRSSQQFQGNDDLELGMATWEEVVADGFGEVASVDNSRLTREEWLSVAVLMSAAGAGLHGLSVGLIRFELVLCAALVMVAARLGGAGAGAVTGAAIAGMAVLNGVYDPVAIGIQAVAGMLAGFLAEYGIVGSTGGYLIGYLLLSSFYINPAQVVSSLWSIGPAVAIAVFARSSWLAFLIHRNPFQLLQRRGAGEISSQVLTDEYEFRQRPSSRSGRRARFRNGLGLGGSSKTNKHGLWIVKRYVELTRELAQTFDQIAPSEERFRQRTMSELIHNLAQQVCTACIHHETCWDREFLKTYQGLSDLLTRREVKGEVTLEHIPEHLRLRCPRGHRLATAVNNAYDLFEINSRWWQKVDATRRTVALQLRAVSEVLERTLTSAPEMAAAEQERSGAAITLPYKVGVARIPKDSKLVSGDSYLHRQIGDDRLVLVLSDGMGAGMKAAAESRTTVNLLEKLLELGLDETEAVRSVNQLLLLRSADEAFTTLDLALIGLQDGSARFIKIGAAPTFVRRGSNVSVIRAGTLPMGVLNEPDIQVTRRVLQRGDVVVMMTDGVIQAWDQIRSGEDWIKGFLANFNRTEPRHIAAALLQEAMRRSPRGVRDDMTVMVLKIL